MHEISSFNRPKQWWTCFFFTTCLTMKFFHFQDRISLFNWLIFLMKWVLNFGTKLNSRHIQIVLGPSYGLLTSAYKVVLPHRNTCSSHAFSVVKSGL